MPTCYICKTGEKELCYPCSQKDIFIKEIDAKRTYGLTGYDLEKLFVYSYSRSMGAGIKGKVQERIYLITEVEQVCQKKYNNTWQVKINPKKELIKQKKENDTKQRREQVRNVLKTYDDAVTEDTALDSYIQCSSRVADYIYSNTYTFEQIQEELDIIGKRKIREAELIGHLEKLNIPYPTDEILCSAYINKGIDHVYSLSGYNCNTLEDMIAILEEVNFTKTNKEYSQIFDSITRKYIVNNLWRDSDKDFGSIIEKIRKESVMDYLKDDPEGKKLENLPKRLKKLSKK
jgi:hypothetical protein